MKQLFSILHIEIQNQTTTTPADSTMARTGKLLLITANWIYCIVKEKIYS